MSDSVGMTHPNLRPPTRDHQPKLTRARHADRVFSHALNTVNKIRIGSEKPPSAIRLKLYGLYKQSMGPSARPLPRLPHF